MGHDHPYCPIAHKLSGLLHRAKIPDLIADAGDDIGLLRRFQNLVRLGHGGCDRLFQKQMDPSLRGHCLGIEVSEGRDNDIHRIQFLAVEHNLVIRVDVASMLVGRGLSGRLHDIADRSEFDILDLGKRLHMAACPSPCSDKPHLDRHTYSPILLFAIIREFQHSIDPLTLSVNIH